MAQLYAAQDPTFRSSTSLVRIDAQVVDASGRAIPNLTQADFAVFDGGQPQAFSGFSFETEPLDLILLFDVSSGMRDRIHNMLRATELGFHELKAGDRVSVMSFDANSHLMQGFTEDLNVVNEAILLRVVSGKFGGSARVDTAAGEAAVRFRAEPASHRKRAILAITDRTDAASVALHELWNANAVFSELILGKPGPAPAIVDRTGGTVITATVPGEAFQASIHYLRSGYAMYYPAPTGAAGAEHAVRVELTPEAARRNPGARVRARSGYTN